MSLLLLIVLGLALAAIGGGVLFLWELSGRMNDGWHL